MCGLEFRLGIAFSFPVKVRPPVFPIKGRTPPAEEIVSQQPPPTPPKT